MSDPRKYWVGFNMVKGIGAARLQILLDVFGDVRSAWNASADELRQVGLSTKVLESLLRLRSSISLDQVWETIERQGITVITWEDENYPARLIETEQPPPVLYLRGTLVPEDDPAVAVVGTRRVSGYGRQVTEEVSSLLAQNGITIVSGLARGVDAIAHQSALNAGGRTLAVLGSGVDRIYPPEHRRLAESMMASGGVLSDYPLGTPPDASNFPPRNRIVSGLARAVVVIEAGESSGALITAAFAAEQGREVYAVPGTIYAPQSKGTNLLIQQGARALLNCQDLLETLNVTLVQEHKVARRSLPADATEAQLFSMLGREPLHIDEIRNLTKLPIETVSAALALMELKGMVRQVGGMNYIALREPGSDYQVN